MADISSGDAKLIQYLNEAYGVEQRLETALEAHIAMSTRASHKKRFKEHVSETKRHAREVKQRIKQLGGVAETVSAPGPPPLAEAAQAVLSGAQKAGGTNHRAARRGALPGRRVGSVSLPRAQLHPTEHRERTPTGPPLGKVHTKSASRRKLVQGTRCDRAPGSDRQCEF